jgi:3-isopropylmalate/(R)-2-methylmalate dehydratase small subunit
MQKFDKMTATAAPLPITNVDTDMIIPKQFLKTIKRTGLKEGLFYELRTDEKGNPKDFVLDNDPWKDAQIIVAGDNFGCGSSREHAPWALLDAGIRCVISTSFADIFYNNCFKNGILPITVSPAEQKLLMADANQGASLKIDLEAQTITRPGGETVKFEIEPFRKHCLLNGLDDIGLTLARAEKIDAFEEKRNLGQPWLDRAAV